MLDSRYLRYGLDALCRAQQMNYFTDGHRGAAIIAAYFFCQEVDVEQGVPTRLAALIDQHWAHTPMCKAFPSDRQDSQGIPRILDVMDGSMDYLRQAGHNVILPAMALKAFHQLPELVTPARVEGICELVKAFTISEPLVLDGDDEQVDFSRPSEAADFVLSELIATMKAFNGRGQGWSGHLLTYAMAILDLRQLGYVNTAEKAEHGFNLYVKRIRLGPLETDKPRSEHLQGDLHPHQDGYWERRMDRPLNLGHCFKYPYGFYGLIALSKEQILVSKCFESAYRIF